MKPSQLRLLVSSSFLVCVTLLTALAEPACGQDIPKGEKAKYSFDNSKVFPGTVRDYWIYVPKQYDPSKPACVYIGQDGIGFKAPEAFDRLIHNKEMPATIGVFVMHGRLKAPSDKALDRFNRSYEYDGLGDNYARFLLEELLPEVEEKTAADGRPIRLSHDGNDRCIGGASSGAVCAFAAEWTPPRTFWPVCPASPFDPIRRWISVGRRSLNACPSWFQTRRQEGSFRNSDYSFLPSSWLSSEQLDGSETKSTTGWKLSSGRAGPNLTFCGWRGPMPATTTWELKTS